MRAPYSYGGSISESGGLAEGLSLSTDDGIASHSVKEKDVTLNTLGDGGEQFAYRMADKPAPSGSTPRTREGKPDLSGAWLQALPTPLGGLPEPLPWVESAMKARNGDPPRQIYLDRRSHPRDANPSYMGHSVGRWEGDTLVVDSVGFNDRIWLPPGRATYPQTEQMHITERFRRPDLGHLEVEMTFDDPGTFKLPWKMKRVSSLALNDYEVLEYVCNENNRDIGHLVGK